jgi:Glutaminase
MRSFFYIFLSIIFSIPVVAAREITTQIHDVDVGTKMGDDVLIFLKSGDVARLKRWDLGIIETLQSSKSQDQWLKITLDKNRLIKRITTTSAPYTQNQDKALNLEEINYTPTTVANMSLAKSYIAESRHETKEVTQCFNRAMVWTYEWWKKHSLRSNKVFIFWPKEYIRRYGFKWWFHVTPYVHVMDNDGQVKERVLDVKWLSRPYSFQDWADYHSVKDVKCKVVEKYSDYADNPFYSDRCYFIRSNMYTWQPADLEMNESWGYAKNAYNMDEVRAAYLEAFDIVL